jgi:hypothetical protein
MPDEKQPEPKPIEKPQERRIPTPGAGFYDPTKDSYEQLVKEGKAPPVLPGKNLLRTPPGVGVNPPPPGDEERYTN